MTIALTIWRKEGILNWWLFQKGFTLLLNIYFRIADSLWSPFYFRYLSAPTSMAFQKQDPAAGYFSEIIHWMKESGIIAYFFRKADPYSDVEFVRPVGEEKLSLEHCLLPFAYVSVGLVLAFVTFLCEWCGGFAGQFCSTNRLLTILCMI